jgi:hypothetical protein
MRRSAFILAGVAATVDALSTWLILIVSLRPRKMCWHLFADMVGYSARAQCNVCFY